MQTETTNTALHGYGAGGLKLVHACMNVYYTTSPSSVVSACNGRQAVYQYTEG